MKKSYTNYLNGLCGNRMDILESLITDKYHKFRRFYKIVSDLSSDIAYITYKFSDNADSLDVDITVNPDVDAAEFLDKVQSETDNDYYISMTANSKVVYISIS